MKNVVSKLPLGRKLVWFSRAHISWTLDNSRGMMLGELFKIIILILMRKRIIFLASVRGIGQADRVMLFGGGEVGGSNPPFAGSNPPFAG